MLCQNKIADVTAREILDSRGTPTIEAEVILEDGSHGTAAAPSGASTGKYEALELRDGDSERYGGRGVLKAVENVNGIIARSLRGMVCNQGMIDCIMIRQDENADKSRLGANSTLAVSLAAAKAGAMHSRLPLYRYIGGSNAACLPVPMMNILNGGAHADNNLDFQEFMIVPSKFDSFSEALRAGSEIYRTLGKILKRSKKSTGIGDEGGFAPDLKSEDEALDFICSAIDEAGYSGKVGIALDCAASEWADGVGGYYLPKKEEELSPQDLISRLSVLSAKYPIISIEDGLGEDDEDGWIDLTAELGDKIMLVGDDLFVTNPKRLRRGISAGAGNAVLIKPNQIGTLSETLEVCRIAAANSYRQILSHRSGETEDSSIADIAVGVNCGFIKTGAPCRGERTAKYNRLLAIEKELGTNAIFGRNM